MAMDPSSVAAAASSTLGADDEGMEDPFGSDARLDNNAETPFDPPRVGLAPAVTAEQQVQALPANLSSLGLAVSLLESNPDDWCPDRGMPDYSSNHRRLLDFYGIKLSKHTQDTDILHRFRISMKLVHPDKLGLEASPELLAWGGTIFGALERPKEELLIRAEMVRMRQIDAPTLEDAFPYQGSTMSSKLGFWNT